MPMIPKITPTTPSPLAEKTASTKVMMPQTKEAMPILSLLKESIAFIMAKLKKNAVNRVQKSPEKFRGIILI